ncbi:MAG: cation transporter [Planctomycetes bacterium]|nr:cation transporter [Planctomycetota bacterium]
MTISLSSSFVILAGKLTAYALTHSAALFSDAAESVVHLAATGFATYSLWYASRPADAKHPYGHGRIAYLSAGFEGALVFAAALTVIYSGITALIRGPELQRLETGLVLAGAVAVVNLGVGLMLILIGRRHHAFILVANGKHVLTDVWTTAAAIVGLTLVVTTGLQWIDSVAAIVLGTVILGSGASLIRRALAGLMDEVDEALSQRFAEVLGQAVREGLIHDFHHLRCRQANDQIWLDVHLLVPGELQTVEAHARATKVEQRLESAFSGQRVWVTSHVEPADHVGAHPQGHPGMNDPLQPARQTAAAESR